MWPGGAAWVSMGTTGTAAAGVVPAATEFASMDDVFAHGWMLKTIYPLPPDPTMRVYVSGGQVVAPASYAVLLHLEREETS
jgi:hypothetical protein